jgi:glycosyltransferase involved in cell wall biosynthesis
LLNAFALLRSTFDCRLILAGEGDLAPYSDLLMNQPNLEIINCWIPEDEIGALFARCDLVVLPYSSASQSGVIPIAAAFGIPVIATRTGGMVEQVEDGISGWLVDAGNADDLADAMRAALSQPEESRRRGQSLKARYETHFSWERIAERLEKSLELAAPARGPK